MTSERRRQLEVATNPSNSNQNETYNGAIDNEPPSADDTETLCGQMKEMLNIHKTTDISGSSPVEKEPKWRRREERSRVCMDNRYRREAWTNPEL